MPILTPNSCSQTGQDDSSMLHIAAVERETGIAKDTLRVWEKRYGFPQPRRDSTGDRVYDVDQVHRLGGADKNLDWVYVVRPSFCLYSTGLKRPRDTLMRFSLYQRM